MVTLGRSKFDCLIETWLNCQLTNNVRNDKSLQSTPWKSREFLFWRCPQDGVWRAKKELEKLVRIKTLIKLLYANLWRFLMVIFDGRHSLGREISTLLEVPFGPNPAV